LAVAVTRTTACRGGCAAAKAGGDGDVGDGGVAAAAVGGDGVYCQIRVEVCCRRKTPIGTGWASEVTANGSCCSSSWFRRRRPSGDRHRSRTTTTRQMNQKCWPDGKRNRWASSAAAAKSVGVAAAVVAAGAGVGALLTAPLVATAPPDYGGGVGCPPHRSTAVASRIRRAAAVSGARLVVGRRSFRAIHRRLGGEGCGVGFPGNIQPRLARLAGS